MSRGSETYAERFGAGSIPHGPFMIYSVRVGGPRSTGSPITGKLVGGSFGGVTRLIPKDNTPPPFGPVGNGTAERQQ